jgi:hypothetical protein
MMIEALLRPVWEVATDILTSFMHGPAKNVHHPDAVPKGRPTWNKTADVTIDLSWSEEHQGMALPQLTHSHTACDPGQVFLFLK